jgi:hypothetical protein
MKILFLLPIIIILLTGCTSTYRISDFSSKDKYFEDFNKSVNHQSLQITLNNDSVITADFGAKIANDSLSVIQREQKDVKINKDEIKDIKYSGNDMSNLSATILLKDGTLAKAKNVGADLDSTISATIYENTYQYFPINKVREASYKNHFSATVFGLIGGTLSGLAVGVVATSFMTNHTQGEAETVNQTIYDIFLGGTILGGIVGYITGWTYVYKFNP